eukprot:CAMPEP_0172573956 /NCGR_PEP_ID=MMETSP1067-20121228/136460_1 /TAXON_ID=265564 ORGANISM="Thalassiosira punctigera, Strain Tpunct2005C2" /NCGR_SAMPLE_ID=MMETSP1067 /ASSEMBLY_ACC=CAM_ASM_000444 /LENGTH=128 /DNA_ID=CAMNT_0013366579 /DNA_START=1391 /DNA_END=1778 /DNA_ORIENTATION=-
MRIRSAHDHEDPERPRPQGAGAPHPQPHGRRSQERSSCNYEDLERRAHGRKELIAATASMGSRRAISPQPRPWGAGALGPQPRRARSAAPETARERREPELGHDHGEQERRDQQEQIFEDRAIVHWLK